MSVPHPEIDSALADLGQVLQQFGHAVVYGSADYGKRLWWNYVVRTTAGLSEWADRLGGADVVNDPLIRFNTRTGFALSQAVLRAARRNERRTQRRVSGSSITSTC